MSSRKIFETVLPDGRKSCLYGNETGDKEVYIDGVWGFTFTNGTCKLNLFTIAPVEDPKFERREVAIRVSMQASTMFALRDFLNNQCRVLEEKGLFKQVEIAQGEPAEPSSTD